MIGWTACITRSPTPTLHTDSRFAFLFFAVLWVLQNAFELHSVVKKKLFAEVVVLYAIDCVECIYSDE